MIYRTHSKQCTWVSEKSNKAWIKLSTVSRHQNIFHPSKSPNDSGVPYWSYRGTNPQQLYLCPSFIVMTSPLLFFLQWLFSFFPAFGQTGICQFWVFAFVLESLCLLDLQLLIQYFIDFKSYCCFLCWKSVPGLITQESCVTTVSAQDVQSQLTGCWEPAPKSENSMVISETCCKPKEPYVPTG